MIIERLAPGVEVGAVRLAGVAALLVGVLTLSAAVRTGNYFGVVSVVFLGLAGWMFLRAAPRNILGLRGIGVKAVYLVLLVLAGVSWYAGV